MTDQEIINALYDLWNDTEDAKLAHLFHEAANRLEELAGFNCTDYCKYHEQSFAEHKDPDEAGQYCLDHYCAGCPLGRL